MSYVVKTPDSNCLEALVGFLALAVVSFMLISVFGSILLIFAISIV